jgi:hypothetical protein
MVGMVEQIQFVNHQKEKLQELEPGFEPGIF